MKRSLSDRSLPDLYATRGLLKEFIETANRRAKEASGPGWMALHDLLQHDWEILEAEIARR